MVDQAGFFLTIFCMSKNRGRNVKMGRLGKIGKIKTRKNKEFCGKMKKKCTLFGKNLEKLGTF